jgi:autotransporter-associated beta strand protein
MIRFSTHAYIFPSFKISKSIIFCLLLLVVEVGSVNGASTTRTWLPTVGGVWTTPANWSPSGQPAAGDDVIINSDQSAPITAIPTISLNSLTVNGTCTLVGSSSFKTLTIGGNTSPDLIISTGKVLTIGSYINITLASSATATINGTLNIASGETFNTDASGVVTTVNGTITNSGTVACTTASRLLFQSSSKYTHAEDLGTIPTATWDPLSTCLITGIIGTSTVHNYPLGSDQTFGNFTWNCSGQLYYIALNSSTMHILGNLEIDNTGTGGGTNTPWDFSIEQDLTVGGNFLLQNTAVYRVCYNINRILTINGDVTVSSGCILLMNSSSGDNTTATVNIAGDFNFPTGAVINSRVTGNYAINNINFNGSGIQQIFTSGGSLTNLPVNTMPNLVNFIVSSPAYLQMANGTTLIGGGGTFTLASGATLGVTSAAGTNGNIQVTGTQLFATGANYIYNGTVAQATGTGLTPNKPANLTINNSFGVKLSNATTITGLLTMTSGTLDMADLALTVGSLTGTTNLTNSTGGSAQTITIGSDNTSPAPYFGIISNGPGTTPVSLTKVGTGILTLSGANTYTGSTSINAGTLKLGVSSAIAASGPLGATGAGTTTVTSGAVLDLNGFSLTGACNEGIMINGTGLAASPAGALTNAGGNASFIGAITLGSASTITAISSGTLTASGAVTGAYALTLDGATGSTGTMSGNLSTPTSIQKNGAGTWILSGVNTYVGATTINAGTVKLGNASALGTIAGITTVNNGAALDLNGFTLSTAEPLTLNGAGLTASPAGALTNTGASLATYNGAITLGSASTICTPINITLGSAGIIGGQDLTKTGSGTLALGSGTAALGGLTNSAGTLTSTSGNMSLTGNFTNNATFTHNSGTVTFNGSGTQSINNTSAVSTFYDFTNSIVGTCTVNTNGITVLHKFTTNTGSTLNMGTNALSVVGTVAHLGTINSQNLTGTPLTSNQTWGGTVLYNATGNQTVMKGNYGVLNINNTGSANIASGDITASTLIIPTGVTLDMGTNLLSVTTPAIDNNGIIKTQNTTTTPITSSNPWGGTVIFNNTTSAQTLPASTFTNLTISNPAGVTLSGNSTVSGKLLETTSAILTIPQGNCMTAATINNTTSAQIYIQSGSSGANGSLIFHNPMTTPVYGTVEMYSLASWNLSSIIVGGKYKWQFMGIPVHSLSTTSPTFDGAYIRQMHENNIPSHWEQLNNLSPLTSFTGYEITQSTAKKYVFQGQLENNDFPLQKLPFTPSAAPFTYPGQSLIGNPYTAAIEISQIQFGSKMLKTVYLYNTGSESDWTNAASGTLPDSLNSSTTTGQYTSIPQAWAGHALLPHQIPSMQAFLVKAQANDANATIYIPYSSTGTVVADSVAQRSIRMLTKASSPDICTIIDVKGSRFSDRMWLFTEPSCTHSFDNGWDGEKFMGSGLSPQIYAMEQDGNYQVNSVDDINNTYLGFRAGEDSLYTLTFTHQNLGLKYGNVYLVDSVTQQTVDITASGTQYTFMSLPTDTIEKRFKIITNTDISTNVITPVTGSTQLNVFSSKHTVFIDNKSDETGSLYLYDMTGRCIQKYNFGAQDVTTIPTDLTPGNYLVKGITKNRKITKNISL